MTELFVMMRYLQHQTLAKKGLTHFDSWASTFGETTTAIELAPEGTGYRARTRFAKFFNLPELLAMFREVADIKTADQLNLPRPEAEYHNVVTQPSEIQKAMVQELSERATRVHNGSVDSTVDNMLKITTDGRKLGLDQRIVNPDLPDNPDSKVNQCVENIFTIWQDTAAERLTQLVFCDLSTPNGTIHMEVEDGETVMFDFQNVYDDIRRKLVSHGIPHEEIAFIHEANTDVQKAALFAKVRSGQVRVLMGSTSKMGSGTNVQDRLIALHDLDAPWKPGDLEQRKGRIVRQGNMNPRVHIYRYVTEGTFDAYSWQTLENKQRFISQIMTSKSPVRTCEDVDETALSFAEVKALCAGDDRIREKMDLDVKVAKLRLLKADHQSKQHWLEDCVKIRYPAEIARLTTEMESLMLDQKTAERHPHPTDGFAGMEIGGILYTEKEDAGKALLASFKDIQDTASIHIGSYRGFQMYTRLEEFGSKRVLLLKDMETHRVELGGDVFGNIVRVDNQLKNIPGRIQARESELQTVQEQLATAQSEMGKPFPQEEELQQMTARLVELNGALDLEKNSQPEQEQSGSRDAPDEPETRELPVIPDTAEPQKKPSVLARLHEMKAAGPTNSSPHKKHQEEVL